GTAAQCVQCDSQGRSRSTSAQSIRSTGGRACTRGDQKSGLVLRDKRRDPLLLVDRLVQQLAEPDGGILQRQTAIVDQPLVRLLDRSQNVSAEALAGLCSEQPFEEHLEVPTPNRRHCHGSEHGEGVLPKGPLIVELG